VSDTDATDDRDTLWITDAEMIRRMGVPEKIARDALAMLDAKANSGFPKKQKLWGDRRYWPAVKDYFDATNKLNYRLDAARSATENRVPHSAAASPPMRRSQRRDMQ
jgi:hypothetical protein